MRTLDESIAELEAWYQDNIFDCKWELAHEPGKYFSAYSVSWDNDEDWSASTSHYLHAPTAREALHKLCEELRHGNS